MTPRTLCTDLPAAEPGSTVRLQGWVHRRRELAQLTFLVVRDRTGLAQVVVRGEADVPPEETPVEVVGTATANPQAPGGVEVTEPTIRALSDDADTPPVELWRPTLNASLPTMLDHAAVTWRHPLQRAKWELAAASLKGFRTTLDSGGFTEVCSPKLVESATESGANVFTVDYFGRPAYLAQSPSPGSGAAPIPFGAATYGSARPDVGAFFGAPFTNSGYNLSVNGVPPGAYQVNVYARSTLTGTFSIVRSVSVTLAEPAIMALDQPFTGTTINRPFTISGWAIDRSAPTGTGVDTLHVWAYPNPGSGAAAIFIGVAAYGSARGDVGAIYGSRFTNSGYSLPVSALAPGNYLFVVYAHSTTTGTFNNYRATHVTVN